jgi:hypothetical protein
MRFNMKWNPEPPAALRSSLILLFVFVFAAAAEGQDRRDWQSLAQLQAGDTIRLSLKAGPVEGAFRNWTPQDVTVGTVTARREDVLRIERYRKGGSGRGKSVAIGALIGLGTGFVLGAASTGNCSGELPFCISRGAAGAVLGVVGAGIGAAIGALLPRHGRTLIYSTK